MEKEVIETALQCDLDETHWVIVSEVGVESGPMTYDAAWKQMLWLMKGGHKTGLTVIAIEAAGELLRLKNGRES
jgi:hypothetical protein